MGVPKDQLLTPGPTLSQAQSSVCAELPGCRVVTPLDPQCSFAVICPWGPPEHSLVKLA